MKPIKRGSDGAKFRKADLHVHTPASYDYGDNLSPEELVEKFVDEGLELVVVADHNTADGYPDIREAAEKYKRQIEILPGVEITTPQGGDNQIHLVAVFPPDRADEIPVLLGQLNINSSKPSSTQADSRIPTICDRIRDHGGLAILAHIDKESGAHFETSSGNIRDKIFDIERVAAIEVVDENFGDNYPEFPAVRSSDAHEPDELGRGYTYLKMTEPSFDGLQTALSDPGSRIRFSKPDYDHAHIQGVRFRGEFLNDRAVRFSPNLNCLIGGKGTGKSTVIEQIRFAFDIAPRTDRIEEDHESLISNTCGDGGEVEVQVHTSDGQQYSVRRKLGEEPTITREDGTETELSIESFRSEFFDLEIHSQGELLELARDDRDQLELIDSYLDFGEKKRERERIKRNLRENAQSLRHEREERDRLESEITDYEAINENLSLMQSKGVQDFLDDEDEWEAEKRRLNRFSEFIESLQDAVPSGSDLESAPKGSLEDPPNEELIQEASEVVEDAREEAAELLDDAHIVLEEAESALDELVESWEELNSDRREEQEELADTIREETGVDISEYFDLKEEASNLEGLKEELSEKEEEITKLENERSALLRNLREVRESITDTRREGISKINNALNAVRVRLQPRDNREEYTEWFNRVLQGSRVRTVDKEAVTDEYDPEHLYTIIENKKTDKLVSEIGLTETAAENIVEHDGLRNQLQELQIQELHDRPIVEIDDEGVWKSLDKMSDGQRCTALLSVAMVERDRPLIVDQPEDMLDNEFIYDAVVETTRRIKESRQIISATHNANIPVLGDAENILVMWSNGMEGYIQERGSIDHPEVRARAKSILEGGEEAFSKRTEKYGALQL